MPISFSRLAFVHSSSIDTLKKKTRKEFFVGTIGRRRKISILIKSMRAQTTATTSTTTARAGKTKSNELMEKAMRDSEVVGDHDRAEEVVLTASAGNGREADEAIAVDDAVVVVEEEYVSDECDEAIVDFIGSGLKGPRKWLGASTVKRKNGATVFYGVPSHASRVLKVECETGRVSLIGQNLGDRKFKYLRGVTSSSSIEGESTIFALPAWGDNVLMSEFQREDEDDENYPEELANYLECLWLHDRSKKWEEKWQWHGGQIASKVDGNLYAIPCNAASVLRVDVEKAKMGKNATVKSEAISYIGKDVIKDGVNKYYGGITGPDGNIYGVPYNADRVLKIIPDKINPRVELLDGEGELHQIQEGNFKWHGGTYCPIDQCIYGFPSHADKILRIECRTGKITQIGGNFPEDMNNGRYKWGGGAVDREGRVYAIPSDCQCVLRIDPRKTVKVKRTITNNINNNDNESIFGSSSKIGAFTKLTFDFNKARESEYLMDPLGKNDNNNSRNFRTASTSSLNTITTEIEVEEPLVEFLGLGLPGMLPNLKNKWQGGVLAKNGMIYGIPCDAPTVLVIDPTCENLRDCVSFIGDLGDMEDKYQGGFLAHDGAIYCIPENAEQVMRVCPPGSTPQPPAKQSHVHNEHVVTVEPLTKSQRKKFLNRRNRPAVAARSAYDDVDDAPKTAQTRQCNIINAASNCALNKNRSSTSSTRCCGF